MKIIKRINMKIAFLSHLDLNLYLFRLPIMKELVKKGYKVYAVCPRGEVFDKFKEFQIEAVEYEIDRGSLNIFKEIKTINNIKKVINSINPDILHTFMHKPNIYGNLTFHKNRINTITGLGSFFIHNDFKSKIIRNLILLGYKLTTKTTKKIIFQNSDDLKLFVDKKIIPKEKAVLIRSSGIDTNEFKPLLKNKKLLKELGLKNKPIVLMIARVLKDKGVEEYIKAANILKDKAEFLYVGDIDKGNKNSFLPKWGNVKYLGFRNDIKELISICDIFVLPSYREGVPRTLLEASAMGKAIVTTDAVGCKEVVEDNKNGFLVPIKDYKSLSKKIELLIENEKLREIFGKNSRKKAVNEFDIKIVVNEYMKVYREIMKNV
jgi:N,N'-diacetylbacillosaminyl-diphospho-undecaprenol alpha-1,3-N-acetylgalactosaminyltransferase